MNKYAPLEKFLKSKSLKHIPMRFSEIEKIIHSALPPSARKHRAWWSNNPSNSVITNAWLDAGYRTVDVNLEGERVTFVKSGVENQQSQNAGGHQGAGPAKTKSPFGALRGLLSIADDYDLTQPTDPNWGREDD